MAVIRPETEMKDSGIEWVGLIPKEWTTIPLKKIVVDRSGGAWGEEPYEGNSTICMRIADFDFEKGVFQNKSEEELTKRSYKETQAQKLLLRLNDICIEKSGGGEKTPVGRAVLFDKPYSALYANFMDRIRVEENVVLPKYVEYYLRAMYFLAVTTLYVKQTTGIQNLNLTSLLESEHILIPTLPEHQAIADYLDKTCSQIDEIIAEAKASIEEYKELREATISNATTKGIRKSRSIKESGVDWLQEVPSDWNVLSPKVVFHQRKDKATPGERQLTASQKRGIIYQDDYMREEGVRVVTVEKDFNILKHVEPDDFVISMRSFQGGLEYSYLRGCISSAYVMLIPNHKYVYSEYYKWLFKSDKYINALQSTSDLIRDGQALRYTNFIKLRLFDVSLDEQKEIADYLNKRIPQIDSLISEKQSLISDLEAYKKSLIYEVVTGKRRVV